MPADDLRAILLLAGTANATIASDTRRYSSRLDGAVERLIERRGGFMIFDEAGGGRGVRGEVGPRTGQAGGALEVVDDIERDGVADEQTARVVSLWQNSTIEALLELRCLRVRKRR
jgi:hypothetical protein